MRPVTGLPARLRPHLIGSWEGGSNLVLVRAGRPGTEIVSHRKAVIARRPERRIVSLAVTSSSLCLANLHASTGEGASRDVLEAARLAVDWAGDSPLVLGGDFNARPSGSGLFEELERNYGLAGSTAPDAIDHLLVRGATLLDPPAAWPEARRDVPDPEIGLMLRLSDHSPVVSRVAA
jgi:hypothetical protein